MKLVLHALTASVIIHIIYFACTMGIGFIKTTLYKPEITGEWEKVDYLQNEIAFKMEISPVFVFVSFVGIAMVYGIVLYFYKSFLRKSVR